MDEAPLLNGLYAKYRYSAVKRGIDFMLSREQFVKLIKSDCYICGSAPGNVCQVPAKKDEVPRATKYSGVDRIDNGRGYVPDNVGACCAACNSIKSKRSLRELKEHLDKMVAGLKEIA